MSRNTGIGLATALAAGVAYGSNAPFATLASQLGVPGGDAIFWRALLMLVLFGGFAKLAKDRLAIARTDLLPVLALGIATAVTSIGYLSSVAFIPVSVAAILFYTYPLIILLLNPLIEGEPPALLRLAVFAVAFIGIILVVGPSLASLNPIGVVLALAASLGATAMFYFSARVMSRLKPAPAVFWVHLLILPVALAVSLLLGGPATLPNTPAFAGIFAVICGSYVTGYFLQLLALKHISPAAAGLLFLSEPAVAILTAAAVLDERLTLAQGIGCAIVFSALIGAALIESRQEATTTG